MQELHDKLMEKKGIYAKWHKHPKSQMIQWLVLLLVVSFVAWSIQTRINQPSYGLSSLAASAPSAPSNVQVQVISSDKVYVSWSPSTDFSGTGLQYYKITATAAGASQALREADPLKTQAAVVGLSANTTYSITVSTVDKLNEASPSSIPVTATTQAYNQNLPNVAIANVSMPIAPGEYGYRKIAQYGSRQVALVCPPAGCSYVYAPGSMYEVAVIDNGGSPTVLPLAGYATSSVLSGNAFGAGYPIIIGSVQLLSKTDLVISYLSGPTVYAAEFNLDGNTSPTFLNYVGGISYDFVPLGSTIPNTTSINQSGPFVGDGTALASGGWAGFNEGTDPATGALQGIWFYRSPSGVWSMLRTSAISGYAPNFAVAQHPADNSIWVFGTNDGIFNYDVNAQEVKESGGVLVLVYKNIGSVNSIGQSDGGLLSLLTSPVIPNCEFPYLIARPDPVHKRIVLMLQAGPPQGVGSPQSINGTGGSSDCDIQATSTFAGFLLYDGFGTGPNFSTDSKFNNIVSHLGVVSIGLPNASNTNGASIYASNMSFAVLPDYVERISPWGGFWVDSTGNINVVYSGFNTTDMSYDTLLMRTLNGSTWSQPQQISSYVHQDFGQVDVLPGAVAFNAPDGTMRMVNLGTPTPSKSHLFLSPVSLSFGGVSGGVTPVAQTLTLSNTGSISSSWQASTNQTWCHISQGSGTTTAGGSTALSASVDSPSNIGTFSCSISFSDSSADNSPQTATIVYTVTAAPDITPPTVPSNLQGSAPDSTKVVLSWSPSTDNIGVTGYRVYRNNTQLASIGNTTSYTDTSVTPSTTYSYTVAAFDAAGNLSPQSSPAVVSVPAPLPDTTPPIVSITSPTNGTVLGKAANITITASASDNTRVTKVTISIDGTLKVTDTSSPYSYKWNTKSVSTGSHTITATAFDGAGNTATASVVVNK